MATIKARPKLDVVLDFTINEAEARALNELSSYGVDEFIKAFYEKLGQHYMQQHEAGLRSFLESTQQFIEPELRRIDEARKVFNET